jgi:hypothetical protein
MKKNTTKTTDLLDRGIDFKRLGPVRRNAFAGADETGPELLALWEMPQLATGSVLLRRGRPRKGKKQTSTLRSVRLPDAPLEGSGTGRSGQVVKRPSGDASRFVGLDPTGIQPDAHASRQTGLMTSNRVSWFELVLLEILSL